MGTLEFAEIDARQEAAERLSIGAAAAKGDPKEIKKQIKEWQKE